MAFSISGQQKVKTMRKNFHDEFGLTIRVYSGRSFADDNTTIAQIRTKKTTGDLGVRKNMKVGNLEDKIMKDFGIKVQVAGSDDSYLCKNDLTLKKALEEDEKKLQKKEKKANEGKGGRMSKFESIILDEDDLKNVNLYMFSFGRIGADWSEDIDGGRVTSYDPDSLGTCLNCKSFTRIDSIDDDGDV